MPTNIEIVRAYFLEATKRDTVFFEKKLRFPIRIGIIQEDSLMEDIPQYRIQRTIDFLNRGFRQANIEFYITKTDVIDSPLNHEFGHFFGLYHTFEENQFGKDDFSTENCASAGDGICDTPPDPGTLFEVYVNYSTCEMMGLYDEKGQEYKPLIDNYMSYYKPCYLREYSFSQQQLELMRAAALSNIRSNFIR